MDVSDFDPLEHAGSHQAASEAGRSIESPPLSVAEEADRIRARADAFRSVADRFYMLWWNLPGMDVKGVDRDLQDIFRMFMDLAPSLGVSRNGISELRECCGRKRTWKDDPIQGDDGQVLIMPPAVTPKEDLGWCPGDIIRRVTRFFGAKYCEKCDRRRRAINALFRCGGQ